VALIDIVPGSLLKLVTAFGFATKAVVGRSAPSSQFVSLVAMTGFRHVMDGILVANGDTLTVPDIVLAAHMDVLRGLSPQGLEICPPRHDAARPQPPPQPGRVRPGMVVHQCEDR
jgi:hypothetical protein